ncbi:MAG: site-2 protease family protein [Chloroflexi bacterium]|nr:site-2 protease family protein [Chloroflexota bacterium]
MRNPSLFLRVFPVLVATVGAALLVSITVHEFSHALLALGLGDRTAQRMGRLSLNPLRHLDPWGTLLLFLVGFGWGKPVPVNPNSLRGGLRGMAIVAAAGPVANGVGALLLALPIRAGVVGWQPPFAVDLLGGAESFVAGLLATTIFLNLLLAIFNLLPFFPLDGAKVVLGLLPRNLSAKVARWEAYGPALLLVLITVDMVTRLGILRTLLGPVVNYAGELIVGHGMF